MATDYAGQRLLFTTELRQARSGQPPYGKLFVADSSGIQPLLIYNYEVDNEIFEGHPAYITNFYDVDAADISSNGAYISVNALRACSGYSGGLCGDDELSTLYDTQGRVALQVTGRTMLSRNGEWAMAVAEPLEGMPYAMLYQMSSSAHFPIPAEAVFGPGPGSKPVADNGTVVAETSEGLIVYQPGGTTGYIPGTLGTFQPFCAIDATGALIVWQQPDASGNPGLYAVHTADLAHPAVLGVPGQFDSQPSLSDDGTTILFLSTPEAADDPQAFLMAVDGTNRRQVTAEAEGIAQAVLSGNGKIVWALTRTGRLLQIDLATGQETPYTEPLAAFLGTYNNPNYSNPVNPIPVFSEGPAVAPGEVVSLPASIMPGERVVITVQGQCAQMVSVAGQMVSFQIPWTAQPGPDGGALITIWSPESHSWAPDEAEIPLQPGTHSTAGAGGAPGVGREHRPAECR